MAESLLENYNPLYDIHLRQYFALPHMQKHLRRMGLLDSNGVPVAQNGNVESELYARHHAMMDMMLRNRERVLIQLSELQKKYDAAEKVEIYRRVRSGVTDADEFRRNNLSRSLSRPRRSATQTAKSSSGRRRHSSNSFEDTEVIKRIETTYEQPQTAPTATIKNTYDRLSANTFKYQFLHKLDDTTLINYKDSLQKQLQKLKRFRDISFGPHNVARHQTIQPASWFFRRRSLPSLSNSAPQNSLHSPIRSIKAAKENNNNHNHNGISSNGGEEIIRRRQGKSQSPRRHANNESSKPPSTRPRKAPSPAKQPRAATTHAGTRLPPINIKEMQNPLKPPRIPQQKIISPISKAKTQDKEDGGDTSSIAGKIAAAAAAAVVGGAVASVVGSTTSDHEDDDHKFESTEDEMDTGDDDHEEEEDENKTPSPIHNIQHSESPVENENRASPEHEEFQRENAPSPEHESSHHHEEEQQHQAQSPSLHEDHHEEEENIHNESENEPTYSPQQGMEDDDHFTENTHEIEHDRSNSIIHEDNLQTLENDNLPISQDIEMEETQTGREKREATSFDKNSENGENKSQHEFNNGVEDQANGIGAELEDNEEEVEKLTEEGHDNDENDQRDHGHGHEYDDHGNARSEGGHSEHIDDVVHEHIEAPIIHHHQEIEHSEHEDSQHEIDHESEIHSHQGSEQAHSSPLHEEEEIGSHHENEKEVESYRDEADFDQTQREESLDSQTHHHEHPTRDDVASLDQEIIHQAAENAMAEEIEKDDALGHEGANRSQQQSDIASAAEPDVAHVHEDNNENSYDRHEDARSEHSENHDDDNRSEKSVDAQQDNNVMEQSIYETQGHEENENNHPENFDQNNEGPMSPPASPKNAEEEEIMTQSNYHREGEASPPAASPVSHRSVVEEHDENEPIQANEHAFEAGFIFPAANHESESHDTHHNEEADDEDLRQNGVTENNAADEDDDEEHLGPPTNRSLESFQRHEDEIADQGGYVEPPPEPEHHDVTLPRQTTNLLSQPSIEITAASDYGDDTQVDEISAPPTPHSPNASSDGHNYGHNNQNNHGQGFDHEIIHHSPSEHHHHDHEDGQQHQDGFVSEEEEEEAINENSSLLANGSGDGGFNGGGGAAGHEGDHEQDDEDEDDDDEDTGSVVMHKTPDSANYPSHQHQHQTIHHRSDDEQSETGQGHL